MIKVLMSEIFLILLETQPQKREKKGFSFADFDIQAGICCEL